VIRNERNLGYGGNQKVGYNLAIDHGLDIVVLLHGDGQYAPELLPDMVAPLERGECDAVFGSRMLLAGAARKGGMPLYKYVGNRILTRLENAMLGTSLSEFHSGYRAYSVAALREVDFAGNSDGFDFDTQIIIQLHDRRMRIHEIPIPTYYGDEICYVNGLRYARDVMTDVLRYRMSKVGPSASPEPASGAGQAPVLKEYTLKESSWSSHGRILSWLAGRSPRKVLDLGCSSGLLAAKLQRMGHTVTGVDTMDFPEAHGRMERFFHANLDEGIPAAVGAGYDVVIAGDVLEHVRHPDLILRQIRELLAPGGLALVSIPNFSHWYPRVRVMSGRFDYDDQGILDRGHVRFFTRRSFTRLVRSAGLEVRRTEAIGVPIERLTSSHSRVVAWASRLDRFAAATYPSLFAYQYLLELAPERSPDVLKGSRSPRG
jgi:2-polyprenyl-3-methyl-5-hydroxy-6-metoxy-1,4-benzoquinol methylase